MRWGFVALGLILVWVGTKMLITDIYKVPIPVSLGVIAIILTIAVAASLLRPKHEAPEIPGSGAGH